MIKKLTISILFFLIFSFCIYCDDYKILVKTGNGSYKYDDLSKTKIPIKKGLIFSIEGFGMAKDEDLYKPNYEDERDWYFRYFSKSVPILYTEDFDYICIENLFPENSNTLFPNEYISIGTKESKKVYLNEECIEAFYKGKREIVKKIGLNTFFNENDYDLVAEYLRGNMETYPVFSNVVITFNTLENLLIKNIKKIKSGSYEVDCLFGGDRNKSFEVENDCLSVWLFNDYYYRTERKTDNIKLKIIFDGDYVQFYDIEQNKLLVTHVLVDKDLALKCADFFQDINVDYSNIKWPRHADGSCDYEDNKKTTSSSQSSSTSKTASAVQSGISTSVANVSVNKTMSVSENLKLRSGEATSTQVLTVMAAGTKVKILELGKQETIDGITSNWVKVEVQAGAKDRDGKMIKAGTVGWCYGGYLK